jgi:hypothetical protein
MTKLHGGLSYANVMATIAVFIALGGASYAALKLPKNSVGTRQLKKKAVTTAKIRREAVTRAKVRKGTLTGAQIKASTLGTVPNADRLDGRDSSDFALAGETQSSGRVVVDDVPGDPDPTTVKLLEAGSFSINANCWDNVEGPEYDIANLEVRGPPGTSFAGIRSDGTELNAPDSDSRFLASINSSSDLGGGFLTAIAPNGDVVTVSGSAETGDPAGDCVFGATTAGP